MNFSYLKHFSETFYKVVKTLIDFNGKDQTNGFSKDQNEQALYEEILHHAQLCKNFAKKFTKRDDLVKRVSFELLAELKQFTELLNLVEIVYNGLFQHTPIYCTWRVWNRKKLLISLFCLQCKFSIFKF